MSKRSCATALTLGCTVLAAAWGLADWLGAKALAQSEQKENPKATPGDGVFGLTKVWHFHLEIAAKDWDKMQPIGGLRGPSLHGFGPRKGPEKVPEKPRDNKPTDIHKGSGFGMDFPWAAAEFKAGKESYKNVGIRFKGNASFMASAGGLKRNFRIDLDHYDGDMRFHGLKSIVLNAGGMDPTRGREVLSYAVFRAAGVPAPRTAFAEVTLTIPNKYDKEYLGLYTFVEHVDKTFLKDRFKNANGLLMKPEKLRDIEYLGEGWDAYRARYNPKRDPKKKEAQRVIEFAKLVSKADQARFEREIGSYLEVDKFLRFLAANALLVNQDCFYTLGHNYFIYLNPETNKFIFFPWDLDLALAGMPMAGSAEQQMDLSLMHPHAGPNKLIDRLLAIKEVNEQYRKILKDLAATCFSKEKLLKDVTAIGHMTKEPLAKEAKAATARKEGARGGFGFRPPGGKFESAPTLRTFVEKRTVSVTKQLAGESKGYVPTMGFGPFGDKGGFGPPGPGGFGPGMFLSAPVLEAADSNNDGKVSKEEFLEAAKRFFSACDAAKNGTLDEKTVANGVHRLLPPPPGFGAAPPPGPGGFGRGPGNVIAGEIFKRADAQKADKLTLPNLLRAAEVFFQESDKDKNGFLDKNEITAAINHLFPAPPGFGPPGGIPGEPPFRPFAQPKKEENDP